MSKLVSRNDSTPPRSTYTEGERAHTHDTNSANRDTEVLDRGQVSISRDGEHCIQGQQIPDHNQENVTEGHGSVDEGKQNANEGGGMPSREPKRKRPAGEDEGEEFKSGKDGKRHKHNSKKGKKNRLTKRMVNKGGLEFGRNSPNWRGMLLLRTAGG
ncbi:hypothetical protein BKA56DRAFT_614870 [Ilyonectria sp. MPI-CAGE-AT-0026]|nr:hypothetical protein BKA56DRAFT_614870 [Ilyonectria sp. MPI-CAGE-AT-0026]